MDQFHSIALLTPEIKELLKEKNYTLLKQVLRETQTLEFADAWGQFDEEERLQIFKLLPSKAALRLFEILNLQDQRYLLDRLGEDSLTPILEGMDSSDLAKIFHRMSPRFVSKMKSLIKRQEALSQIDLVMKYDNHTVGSLMHPEFIRLGPKLTAKQALLLLQAVSRPNQKEHLYSLYVTDDAGKVLGALSLQDLVSSPADETIGQLMTSIEGVKLQPTMDQEDAAKIFTKYSLASAPVIDADGKLLGVLTLKDILSVVRQEATEDFAKIAGTKIMDLSERSVFSVVWVRMPWLLVTLAGGTIVSLIIRSFEPVLSQVIALASFSPLIAGMGGNVGSQSATVIVRNMALGNLPASRRWRTAFLEFGVGLSLGTLYGCLLGLIAYVIYGPVYGVHFSIVVAMAMCTAMTIAATMGSVGPMIFDKFGIDPATAAGPIVSTTTDIFSNFIYFFMATLLLLH